MKRPAFLLLLAALLASGCGSLPVRHSARMGLFDYLKSREPVRKASKTGRPEPGIAEESHRRIASAGAKDKAGGAAEGMREPASSRRLRAETRGWKWPLRDVQVTSEFGRRGNRFHEGIDLRAPLGTDVLAVSEGKVIYAGNRIGGYGNMVIVSHDSGLHTIYAHNSRLFVRTGQNVSTGQRLALSGNTGHSTGPHLHFELRSGIIAVNPVPWLPAVARHKTNVRRALASSR